MVEQIDYRNANDFLTVLWRRIWWVLISGIVGGGAALLLSFTIEPRYRSTVSLVAVDTRDAGGLSSLLSQASGLASIIGMNRGSDPTVEAVEFLKSHFLRESFIDSNNLLPVLFEDQFNAEAQQWIEPESAPTLFSGSRKLEREIISVDRDSRSGLIEVSAEWGDPAFAKLLANDYVEMADQILRERAVNEFEASLGFLRQELERADVVAVRQAVSGAIEQQVARLAMLKGKLDYAYRVIDPAVAADEDAFVWPRRLLLSVAGFCVFCLIAGFIVVLGESRRDTGSSAA